MASFLRPAHREKKRYVVYKNASYPEIIDAYEKLFGISGIASAGPIHVEKGVMRVAHTAVTRTKAALAWCGGSSVMVSGSLKKTKIHKE